MASARRGRVGRIVGEMSGCVMGEVNNDNVTEVLLLSVVVYVKSHDAVMIELKRGRVFENILADRVMLWDDIQCL